MGDRGNIVVQEKEGERVYLYTHWSGERLPEILRVTLARGESRWDDPQYLARVIFCGMVEGRSSDELTGYGISSRLHDNGYSIIVVDCEKQEVRLEAQADGRRAPSKPKTWTMADFAALPAASWGNLDEARKRDQEDAA